MPTKSPATRSSEATRRAGAADALPPTARNPVPEPSVELEAEIDAIGAQALAAEVANTQAVQEAALLRSMLDNVPINIMTIDLDLKLTYMNPASTTTLEGLQSHLSVPVDQMIGTVIDIFHTNPEHQRRMLADPSNLPHTANIQLGPETLELNVSALHDPDGNYVGAMATWAVVTEKVKLAARSATLESMVENASINMMVTDLDLNLTYMNPASRETLRSLQAYLPVPVDEIEGSIIDIFHRHPEHQRRMLADPSNLPHTANIQLGPETLELNVTAVLDDKGNHAGAMATWQVVTEKLATENQLSETASVLAKAAETLSEVATGLGANAEETAAQANVVSAASEEVSVNITTVATASEEMSSSINEISRNAQHAAEVATSAVEVARRTNTTVSKLGDSSAEIGQIVKVITSIAQQTNLLALNATIEAARAGEAGKGFAVVANEVKELAKETARATEDISHRIEVIQADTGDAVEAIGSISTIIDQINDIQNTIAAAVEEQAATTSEIGRNVSEASRGSTEIAENILSVAGAATSTAEGATEVQRSASELTRTAAELQALVDRVVV